MKRIGVLGVGDLTERIVRGLRNAAYSAPIHLSPRNAEKAERLARDYGCVVMPDNQSVVDTSELILLGVRPGDLESLAGSVDIRPEHRLLSFIAGTSHRELRRAFRTENCIRVMLSYAAEHNNATVVLNPPSRDVETVLSLLGALIPIERENQFELATVAFCMHGWFYFLLHDLQRWITEKGLEAEQGRQLILGSLADCVAHSRLQPHKSFADLGRSIATPGTYTALGLEMLDLHQANAAWSAASEIVLDALASKSEAASASDDSSIKP